jgi:cystathionine gamma-lyase
MSIKDFTTKCIRSGQDPDKITGSIVPAIHQASTFLQPSPGKHLGYDYSRCANPTRSNLATNLASIEDCKYCLATASGLSAVATVISLFKQGANIICGDDVYGGVYRLLTTVFEDRYNIKWVDTTNPVNVQKACEEFGNVDLLWIEAVSNPLLKITDIKKVSEIAKKYGALVAIDNTFMTPYFQRPLKLGADVVVHSLTKYINGHSDVIAGAILTDREDLHKKFDHIQKTTGPALSPFDSWLVLRGVKTLSIRMQKHQQNAITVANFLRDNKNIEKVFYPGFKDHPNHEVLMSQTINNFAGGGMISFYTKCDPVKMLEKFRIIQLAESLGGVESLVCIPAMMTHGSIPKSVRDQRGITENLVRISVGIEGIEDLISDLEQAIS